MAKVYDVSVASVDFLSRATRFGIWGGCKSLFPNILGHDYLETSFRRWRPGYTRSSACFELFSHQLDGTRAGFINKRFDLMCLEKIVSDPQALARYSAHDLARDAGSQGVELLMWFAMRGAMTGRVSEKHHSYHIPISNTAAAVMVLENKPEWADRPHSVFY